MIENTFHIKFMNFSKDYKHFLMNFSFLAIGCQAGDRCNGNYFAGRSNLYSKSIFFSTCQILDKNIIILPFSVFAPAIKS